MERSPYYPFPARPGTGIEDQPSKERQALNPEQLQELIDFGQGLYDINLNAAAYPEAEQYRSEQEENGVPIPSIGIIWRKRVNAFSFGVNYLLSDQGRTSLQDSIGRPVDYDSTEALFKFLGNIDFSLVPSKALDEIEASSVGYEEDLLTSLFLKDKSLPPPNIVSIYRNPETIIEKARSYRQIKTYLKLVGQDLKNNETENDYLLPAKKFVLSLYKQKINNLLADTYITAEEYLASPSSKSENVERLMSALPAFNGKLEKEKTARFLENIDRYMQGVSSNEQGEYTWLSPEAKNLAALALSDIVSEPVDRGIYVNIDKQLLENTEIDGETMGELMRTVLDAYGLLSESREWDSTREGPAPDNKWQVIVDDKFKSLSVNNKQQIVKVPASSRSLLMALVLISHEVTHVLQHHNKQNISELALLKDVGLDSVSEQTEAGAKWQESVARETLTGEQDNTIAGLGYLRALEIKAKGGSYGECVEAYFKELQRSNPGIKTEVAAKQAVNRARRIFRSGGRQFAQNLTYLTNTQPLSYLEQQLIYKRLDDRQRKSLFVGGVKLDKLQAMINLGLVNEDKILIPNKKPIEILKPKVEELLASQTKKV